MAFHRYLPEDSNPRLTELGQELGQRFAEPQQIIDFVLSEYRNQLFYYTLQPPLLSNNSLDQFYFNTKQGFCEHYASTFAFIMRAAGIPSRLVAGYLGGQYNEQGNYYSVYQSDAHAWVEVWLPERGWVTVDPTSAVSPERVSNSMADILRRERISLAGAFSWASFTSSDFMLELRMQIEAIDYQWNRLVVGFSLEKQYQLLTKLFGHGHFWKGMLIIVCVMALTFVFQWLRNQWRKNRKRAAPWRVALDSVFNALEKQGIERGKSQTPQALVPSIKNKLPTLVSDYQLICHLHQKLVYHATTNELEEQLTKQIQHQAKLFKKRLMSLPK
ncbi:transglutaminase family protein [Thalassotalea euphylliae]|uniref:transglutaminase-like domain-containing protein n=1 Tax=Thalassotalea euphylliae TaxID=1655234 RepID=UPI0036380F82